jgi:hypothetical protein
MKKTIQHKMLVGGIATMQSFRAYSPIRIRRLSHVGFIMAMFSLTGCATYVTPGGGAVLSSLTESDVQEVLNRKPASPFPARLAVVRIQAPDYYSYRCESYGHGRYSVVTTRDIETDEHFRKLERLPMISAVACLSQILIPPELRSDKELRLAAAKLQTDMLLVYTLNTSFRVKDHDIGPFGVITLGFLPNQEAQVTATASAVVYDVRTGFVYGLAESTAHEKQIASIWTSQNAVDESRIKAEKKAFEQMLDEFAITWKGIVEQHAKRPASQG